MPLQKLKFQPGVNRENTSSAAEGTWFDVDKVRFRSGSPEKIGGWVRDTGENASGLNPPVGSYWGIARSLWNWVNLTGSNLLAVGTNLKYCIQNTAGGDYHDVTPIRRVSVAGAATFAATEGSDLLVVTDSGNNATPNDFVTFTGAVGLGGDITADILNAEHQVVALVSATQYSIRVSVPATSADVGNGGSATVARYQLNTGAPEYTVGVGWGAGGWGGVNPGAPSTGWGEAAPIGAGLGIQLRTWSQANYGEDLIINPRGGALYYWKNNADPKVFDRAVLLAPSSPAPFTTDANCPVVCNLAMVSDASRFVLAFGCNEYGETDLDPLLVRWSDQENYTVWTPAITNQAGSFRLSTGSQIVTAQQTRQEILVWTDSAVYSMQYQGPPFVWGFQPLATNTTILGPNVVQTVHDVSYWMGADKFYVYNGRVQTLPCSVRQYVFQNINLSQSFQFFAGINDGFSEVWWFYCSANSSTIDRYVVYNYLDNTWYYGTMERTAWVDVALRNTPIAAGYGGQVLYHEVGNDDGTVTPAVPIESFIQSADVDIGDGHNFSFIWRMLPDVTFDGSSSSAPEVDFELRPRQFPGSAYGPSVENPVVSGNNYIGQKVYNVQRFTPQVNVRVRGRQLALRISSAALGTAWQLGVPSIDIRQDGRK
jgi:hypothetical protein